MSLQTFFFFLRYGKQLTSYFLPIPAKKNLMLKKYLGFILKYLLVQEAMYRDVLALSHSIRLCRYNL